MAWIATIAATSAATSAGQTGQRRKPNKWAFFFMVLVMGSLIPLSFILIQLGFGIFPLVLAYGIVGIVSMVVLNKMFR